MRRVLISWAIALPVVLVAALVHGWWQVDGPGAPSQAVAPPPQPRPLGDMDFALVDHEGRAVGPDTLIGKASMVFFGFTYCPDVCPTTLADISGWLAALGEDAARVNPVFITVDPQRDTREAMAGYVAAFDPRIRGWTGAPEEIAKAAEGFRAVYRKVPLDGGDYTMDHTAGVFLYDADGRFVATIDHHEPPDMAVPKLCRALGAPMG